MKSHHLFNTSRTKIQKEIILQALSRKYQENTKQEPLYYEKTASPPTTGICLFSIFGLRDYLPIFFKSNFQNLKINPVDRKECKGLCYSFKNLKHIENQKIQIK